MTNINPIDFSQLIAWLEGKLPEEEAQEIAQQVAAADEETRQVVESLRLLIQDSTVQLENPPEKLRPLLMRRFRAFAKDWQQPSVLQRLVGLLTFDSWQHAAAGVRSAATIEAEARRCRVCGVGRLYRAPLDQVGWKGVLLAARWIPTTTPAVWDTS